MVCILSAVLATILIGLVLVVRHCKNTECTEED
mgnify:CR=1 FL=1